MPLISRWDIREESYSDTADITSLTELAGSGEELIQLLANTLPEYRASDDYMVFGGTDAIGIRAGMSAGLNTALKGSTWTLAILIKQGTLLGDWLYSFGADNGNLSLSIRSNSSGNAIAYLRNTAGSSSTSLTSTTSFATDTEVVLFASLTAGGDLNISIDDGTLTTEASPTDLSAETFAHIGIGAYNRNSVSNKWTGGVVEARVYDTDETSNRTTIAAAMKAGPASASAAITGTMTATVDEDDITTGGKTIIVTLTDDTFKTAGTGPIGSTADTQALIDGFDAASSPTNGWNNEVRDKALTSEVVRTSSTVATWTVAAQAGYDVSAQEEVTGTIPVAVLVTGAGAITATPTFTIDASAVAVVDDVNSGEVLDGETSATFNTTGFAGEITSIKLVSGSFETDATNISSTSGDGTFDLPDISAIGITTAGCPLTTASHAVVARLSDGTDTVDFGLTYSPISGWAVVELVGTISQGPGNVTEDFDAPAVATEQIYHDAANNSVVASDGTWTTDSEVDVDMVHFKISDGEFTPFTALAAVDVTPPVITLLGSTPIDVEASTTYVDAGATALDDVDGDITGDIVTVNPVNTSIPAQYIVTYNVDDAAGNSATEVTRTVNVVDTTAPVITLLGSTPVNVEVDTSYVDAGATASDSLDGDITGDIVTVNPVDIAVIAQYIVTYNVDDAASNSAIEVTRTVNVVAAIDTTPPVITLLGSTPIDVEAGDTYVDAGATALDDVDGDITGDIVTVNPVNTAILDTYVVTYNVDDTAGNPATEVTRTVNVIDTTPPVITRIGGAIINVEVDTSYSDLGATAFDNLDGDLTGSIITVNPVNIAVIAQYTVTYNVTDSESNVATEVTRTVNVVAEILSDNSSIQLNIRSSIANNIE